MARFRLDDVGALEALAAIEGTTTNEGVRLVAATYRLAMDGKLDALGPKLQALRSSSFTDPEGFYLMATYLAKAGASDEANDILDHVVRAGYACPTAMRSDSYWDGVRYTPSFARALSQAEAASNRARDAFEQAGGAAVVSPPR